MTLLACAVAVALCVLVVAPPAPRQHLGRRLPGMAVAFARPAVAARRTGPVVRPVLVLPLLGGGVLVFLGPAGPLLAATAALVLGGLAWLYSAGRQRRRVDRGRRQTIELCDALTAELRAGRPPVSALACVGEQYPAAQAVARACMLGADVPDALRRAARAPGAGGLAAVAAAWQVADASGCGLVATLDRAAEGLRADDATSAEVAASLSPARATARMLAALPAFGLLLGAGLGGNPLALLVGTPVGNVLLLVGVALALAGTVWVERLAAAVEWR